MKLLRCKTEAKNGFYAHIYCLVACAGLEKEWPRIVRARRTKHRINTLIAEAEASNLLPCFVLLVHQNWRCVLTHVHASNSIE